MKVGKCEFNVDLMTILIDLRDFLQEQGILRFQDIRELDTDIMVSCPIHKGKSGLEGQEAHASCGVRKADGMFHCFACGYTAPLDIVISGLLGFQDGGQKGLEYLKGKYNQIIYESRQGLNLPSDTKPKQEPKKYVTEEELDKYRYIHPYMYKRKLTNAVIEKFDIGYDDASKCLTFPVWDKDGNCVFVARRSVYTKFFNYPKDADKPVYLLNYILKEHMNKVYVCESFINALTLWGWGYPAIALIGTGSDTQYKILNGCDIRSYVLCLDGDNAGRKGTDRFVKNVKDVILFKKEIPEGKDVNDLTKEEFEKLQTDRI